MPRPRRLNLVGIPQHITQRGNNRQACFFLTEDRLTYLKLMDRAARRRDCHIHAYVLMTSHVHILATPLKADGISRLVQDIGREYVRYINSSYRCNALGQDDELITPHEEWMALGVDHRARCAAYGALFDDAPQQSQIDEIRYSNRKGLPMGRESFKSQIENQLEIKLGSGKVGRPPKSN